MYTYVDFATPCGSHETKTYMTFEVRYTYLGNDTTTRSRAVWGNILATFSWFAYIMIHQGC
jgi:hypothetical protein